MSHGVYEWVMARTSDLTWMRHFTDILYCRRLCQWSHVKYEWIMSPINKFCHVWLSHVTHESVDCVTSSIATDGGNRTSNNYDCQNFQQVFTGVPVHIKHVFSGLPKISNSFSFSRGYTESPSLKRSTRKSGRSGDPNILSLISSVSG